MVMTVPNGAERSRSSASTLFATAGGAILATLVTATGDKTSPSLYVMLGAALAAVSLLRLRFRSATTDAELPRLR